MAGKESRGVEHADADLFRGRPYVLTSREPQLETWIERFGARLVILDPAEHDRQVAFVSHLPQLLSTTLAACCGEPEEEQVAGPAAADLTRLALSPYDIWRDIFATNASPSTPRSERLHRGLEKVRTSSCALRKTRKRSNFSAEPPARAATRPPLLPSMR